MFIVEVENNIGEKKYIGHGEWVEYDIVYDIKSARHFETIEDVNKLFSHKEFTTRTEFSDGSSAPPHIIWSGLDICVNNPEAAGKIRVLEVKLEIVSEKEISDKLINFPIKK